MMKSKTSKSSLEYNDQLSTKDKMFAGDVKVIEENISSNNNLGCILAIEAVIINQVKTDIIIRSLKKLKSRDEVEFCMNVSELAIAALHLLKVEHYTGDNENIKTIIHDRKTFD